MNPNNNFFGDLSTDDLEQSQDTLGGGGAFDSDVYTGEIVLAYAGESSGGARSVTVHVDVNGRTYRETIYVTSGKEKGQKNYYERGGKKVPLPGFTHANDLALLSTGQPLSAQTMEEKVVELYNFDERKEVPTKVMAITSMMGKQVSLGILKNIEDKTKKNDSTGAYEATGETRETNNIDKVFHAETGKTVSEFVAKAENAEFIEKWRAKFQGTVRNKATGAAAGGGKAGLPGRSAAPAPGAGKPAGKSLFGG